MMMESNNTTNDVSLVYSDMSKLIRLKEKELQEVHDLRCKQLENMIKDRDSLLIDISKRYELMRDDFQYNLKLLEARDKEILRLESLFGEKLKELMLNEAERKNLMSIISSLELQDQDKQSKYEKDKMEHKRILQELKEVIESMRWAATEENNSRIKESNSLKAEIQRLHITREEALELQRKDLTDSFEKLMKQRDDSLTSKERKVGEQIMILDSKFEQLQTENNRLKSENSECRRNNEQLVEEARNRDDICRQLQWTLDDERISRQREEDNMKRQIQQAQLDLNQSREALMNASSEFQRKLDKAISDVNRERDFRFTIERKLEEHRDDNQKELSIIERELNETRSREEFRYKEIITLREERDAALERATILRADLDAIEIRHRSMERENGSLREDVLNLRFRIEDKDSDLSKDKEALLLANEEIANLHKKIHSNSINHQKAIEDTIAKSKILNATAIDSMRNELLNEISSSQTQTVTGYIEKISSLEEIIRNYEKERYTTLKQVEDEKAEAEALKLRLRLQETQVMTLQQEIQQMQQKVDQQQMMMRSGSDFGALMKDANLNTAPRRLGLGIDVAGVASPLFSEDFGPASFPASPMNISHDPSRYQQPHYNANNNFNLQKLTIETQSGRNSQDDDNDLATENERLKAVIREMRMDVETLQAQILDKTVSDNNDDNEKDERLSQLERCLEQTVEEVTRLKRERKRLMDVSNELRAALNRTFQQNEDVKHEQELESIFTWLANDNSSSSSSSSVISPIPNPNKTVPKPTVLRNNDNFIVAQPPPPPSSSSRRVTAWTDNVTNDDSNDKSIPVVSMEGRAIRQQHLPIKSEGIAISGSNSNRTTTSQLKARQRIIGKGIKQQQTSSSSSSSSQPRKVMNYANYLNDNDNS